MKSPSSHRAAPWAIAFAILISGSIASAADVVGGANGVSLSSAVSKSHSVRITGPNGYSSVSSGKTERAQNVAPLVDGSYRYEVTEVQCAALSYDAIKAATRDNAANGRAKDAQPSSCREVVVDSGAFRIVNGVVPDSTLAEE